jgi:hypothetical protein
MNTNASTGLPLERVLRPRTVREIGKLAPHAEALARRWAQQWPAETRQLELSGKLLTVLKQRAEEESLLQWRGRVRASIHALPGSESAPLFEAAPPPPGA